MSLKDITPEMEKAIKDVASFTYALLEGLGCDDWFKMRVCEFIMVGLFVGNDKPNRPEPKKFFKALAREMIELVENHPDYVAQMAQKT